MNRVMSMYKSQINLCTLGTQDLIIFDGRLLIFATPIILFQLIKL